MIGDTWSPKSSMSTLKYLLAYASKHKSRVKQLDFIGVFLQANVKHKKCEVGQKIWIILPRIFGRSLILKK